MTVLRWALLAPILTQAAWAQQPVLKASLHPAATLEQLISAGPAAALQVGATADMELDLVPDTLKRLTAAGFTEDQARSLMAQGYLDAMVRGRILDLSGAQKLDVPFITKEVFPEASDPTFNGMARDAFSIGFARTNSIVDVYTLATQSLDGTNPALKSLWIRSSPVVVARRGDAGTVGGVSLLSLAKTFDGFSPPEGKSKKGFFGSLMNKLGVDDAFMMSSTPWPQAYFAFKDTVSVRYRSRSRTDGMNIRLLPLSQRSDDTPDVPAFSLYSRKPPTGYTPVTGYTLKGPLWAGMYGMEADFVNLAEGQYLILIVNGPDSVHPITSAMIQVGGKVPQGGLEPKLGW